MGTRVLTVMVWDVGWNERRAAGGKADGRRKPRDPADARIRPRRAAAADAGEQKQAGSAEPHAPVGEIHDHGGERGAAWGERDSQRGSSTRPSGAGVLQGYGTAGHWGGGFEPQITARGRLPGHPKKRFGQVMVEALLAGQPGGDRPVGPEVRLASSAFGSRLRTLLLTPFY